jgi:hypothetical protein
VTEDNVIDREDQDCHINEEPSGKIKRSAYLEYCTTGSVGAPTRKGITIGCGNRRNKSMPQTDRLGGGKDITTTSHRAGGIIHVRKEHPGLGAMPMDNIYVRRIGTSSD